MILENDDLVVYYTPGEDLPVIYLFEELNQELVKLLEQLNKPIAVITLKNVDWEKDFSPWPYDKFKGQGDKTIERIMELTSKLNLSLSLERYFAGYSLGGLMALYALTKADLSGCASVSGSLWYPNLVEYLLTHSINNKRIYLSLGTKEPKTKNQLMQTVGVRSEEIKEMLAKDNSVVFQWNPGNHFQDSELRLIKGIDYLLGGNNGSIE